MEGVSGRVDDDVKDEETGRMNVKRGSKGRDDDCGGGEGR